MKNTIAFISLLFLVLIAISIIMSRVIIKRFSNEENKPFFSKKQYDKCCKQRNKVLNNIPITFDAHCRLKKESDIYCFYDKTIEEGIDELKSDRFSISVVGRI